MSSYSAGRERFDRLTHLKKLTHTKQGLSGAAVCGVRVWRIYPVHRQCLLGVQLSHYPVQPLLLHPTRIVMYRLYTHYARKAVEGPLRCSLSDMARLMSPVRYVDSLPHPWVSRSSNGE